MKMRLMIMLMAILFSLEFAQANTLMAGSRLEKNQRIYSSNGSFYLTLLGDGNLCIYTALNKFAWCTMVFGFSGASSALTTEGNFEVYDEKKVIKWSTKTHPNYDVRFKNPLNKPVKLVVLDDGTFALFNAKNDDVWSNKKGVYILEPNMQFMSSQTKAIIADYFKLQGGIENSKHSQNFIYILTTRFTVEDLVKASNYQQAKIELDKLWALFPVGSIYFWNFSLREGDLYLTDCGYPSAYHALRMLTNIVDYKLKNIKPVDVLTSTFRVVLAKCAQGLFPKTMAEYQSNTGRFEKRMLDSKLTENNYRIIYTILDLFLNYVNAISDGKLNYVVKITEVNTCIEVGTLNHSRAGLKGGYNSVMGLVPKEIHDQSDIYWLLYPSAVPVDGEYGVAANAGFNKILFTTGSQGRVGIRANKAVLTIDDTFMTRTHNRYKFEVEQRTSPLGWLQHEFFHFLFAQYPLNLEPVMHIWFTRAFWPKDFQGTYEPDYFHEAVFRRFKQEKPILAVRLNPTLLDRLISSLNINMFIGKTFDCSAGISQPNSYHYAKIIQENNRYYWWLYKGSSKWEIVPEFRFPKFSTRNDCPYIGSMYEIVFETKDTGEYTGRFAGLRYQGYLYKMT